MLKKDFLSEAIAFMLAVATIIVVTPYLYSPSAYVLTHKGKGLVIRRILSSIFIPYSEIAYVSIVNFNEVSSAVDIEA